MSRYEYEDDTYIDGEEKRPKLLVVLGTITLILIFVILIVSCVGKKTEKSNNTNLSYLRVSNGVLSPMFSNSITNYTLNTEEEILSISCSTESDKASVIGCNSKIILNDKNKEHVITVTAEDGTTKAYKILINYEKKLEELSVNILADVESGKAVTEKIELRTEVLPISSSVVYEWYKDGKKTTGSGNKLTVTQSGNYYVKVINKESNKEASSSVFVVNIKEKIKDNSTDNKVVPTQKNDYYLNITKINGNSKKWTQSVTLSVEASTSNGLHPKAYSFDGGKTYQASNSKKFTSNQTVKIVVKDIKGNTTSKAVKIDKIDLTVPKVSISELDKTNKTVTLKAMVTPEKTNSGYKYEWYKNGERISGASGNTYKVTSSGNYKVKVITGANKIATSSEYKFTTIDIKCPTVTATSTAGYNIPAKTWFNEVIYLKVMPFDDTKNFDIYLNEYGKFDTVSNKFTYLDTFKSAVKIKIVNNGLRVIKIVVRDQNGNSETCYSDVYYLK